MRYGDLPGDLRTLIEQIIENDDVKILNWMQCNYDLAKSVDIPLTLLSVADCYEVVREWPVCFDRGEPHIERMCEDKKAGEILPPIVHHSDGLPLDGRHRITAAYRMGEDFIDSMNLDEIVMEMKKLRYRQKKELDQAQAPEGSEPV